MNDTETSYAKLNETFNTELDLYAKGAIPYGHVFQLGLPGTILKNCGFPPDQQIELSASHLARKSKLPRHPFSFSDIKNLVMALQEPVAVFSYGDNEKSQNVIVDIQKDNKHFYTGIHFSQTYRGSEVSDIRTIFNKPSTEWLNWIEQGKLIYADLEKIKVEITQQRMTLAEVGYLNLNSIDSLLQRNQNVKHFYTEKSVFGVETAIAPQLLIPKENNTPEKFKANWLQLCKTAAYKDAPYEAAAALIKSAGYERQTKMKLEARKLGINDEQSAASVLKTITQKQNRNMER